MARRSRVIGFGSAAALVLAGLICAVVIDGLSGRILTAALTTAGLGAAILLVFLEIGLGEDRELEREEESRRGPRRGFDRRRGPPGSTGTRRRP